MRWLAKGKSKLFREKTGFTLIEIAIAVGMIAAIAVGFLTALNTNSRATRNLDERVTAANLATAYLEAIKESPYADNYTSAGDNIDIPIQYSVTVNTECSSDGTNFSACTGSDNETLQRITVIISREGEYILSLCTYRSKR